MMQEPPNLTQSGDAPDLPKRPATAAPKTPPQTTATPPADAAMISEQARMLKEYEDRQAAILAEREAEERRRREAETQRLREFEDAQRQQAERERQAQERLLQEQQQQQLNAYSSQIAGRQQELEREILAMRGQYERDQLMLEQYDRVGSRFLLGLETQLN